MTVVAARARRRPTSGIGWPGESGPMPWPCGFSAVSASRDAWRTTSWFDSTQVAGAPTAGNARSDSEITSRIAAASHSVMRYGS
jgi:hypothetical protein